MLPPYIVGLIKLWAIVRPFLKENFMGKGQLGGWFRDHMAFATLFACVLVLSAVCIFLMDQLNASYNSKHDENTEIVILKNRLAHTEDKITILMNVIRALNNQPMLDMPEYAPTDTQSIATPYAPKPEPVPEPESVTIRSRLDDLASEDIS